MTNVLQTQLNRALRDDPGRDLRVERSAHFWYPLERRHHGGGRMAVIDGVGLMAGFFTICAFYCRWPVPLRVFAVLANLLSVTYGMAMNLMPVALLPCILLPLNTLRLWQSHAPTGRGWLTLTDSTEAELRLRGWPSSRVSRQALGLS